MPSDHDSSSPRWDTLLRYRVIEVVALWEGRLTTNHLCASFAIGRQQASRDINEYLRLAPGNLVYDAHIKGYIPSSTFAPRFTQGTADEYLHLLDRNQELAGLIEPLALPMSHVQALRVPVRHITPEVLRPLMRAAREQRRVEVFYRSMTVPEGEDRVIAPHALVFSGLRWHVRAYCERNKAYRDFVLSRFSGSPDLMDASPNPASEDTDWITQISLRIGPNPHLSPGQQAVVAADLGMDGSELLLDSRLCLAQYKLDLLQVATRDWEEKPEAHPVVLLNPEVMGRYLLR